MPERRRGRPPLLPEQRKPRTRGQHAPALPTQQDFQHLALRLLRVRAADALRARGDPCAAAAGEPCTLAELQRILGLASSGPLRAYGAGTARATRHLPMETLEDWRNRVACYAAGKRRLVVFALDEKHLRQLLEEHGLPTQPAPGVLYLRRSDLSVHAWLGWLPEDVVGATVIGATVEVVDVEWRRRRLPAG